MIVLVANVGERDLYYNVGTKEEPNFCHCKRVEPDMGQLTRRLGCQPGTRHVGAAVLARIKDDPSGELERCRYPILKTVIEEITKTQKIDSLVLVVTDQPTATQPQYRDGDSANTGQILQKVIQHDFKDDVGTIWLQRYQKRPSPSLSYDFFGDLLPQIAPRAKLTKFYASISGGIPALNTSLQQQALRIYRDKCSLYEVEPPDEQSCRLGAERSSLRPVSSDPFIKDMAISLVEQLIGRYDYSGALEVLKAFSAVRFWETKVEALLHYAEDRLNFNFKQAAEALQAYSDESPLKEWYEAAREPVLLNQLVETYFIAELRYKNQEYPDMLWRVAAFYENGLRLIGAYTLDMPELLQLKHIPQSLIQERVPILYNQLVEDSEMLTCRSYIKMGRKKGREEECWRSTRYTWKKLANFGLQQVDKRGWQYPFNLLNSLRKLAELRNKMIHDFAGVSPEDLDGSFTPSADIIPTLYKILNRLISLTDSDAPLISPYDHMNAYLGERLRSSI